MSFNSDNFSIERLICEESFQQYCLGNNISSQIFWEDWLKNNADKLKEFTEAKRIFYMLSAKQGNRLDQLQQLRVGITQFEDFKKGFEVTESPEKSLQKKEKTTVKYFLPAMLIASSLIIIASLTFYFYSQTHFSPKAKIGVYTAGKLNRKTIILEDGSVITLRNGSKLKISKSFNLSYREVWLSGEAFFNVKHNQKKPFIVHAAENNIKVLGTIFNVKAYPNTNYTETSLLQGSVSITHNLDKEFSVVLKPNQKLISSLKSTVQTNSDNPISNKVENLSGKDKMADETKWVRNRMDIENQTLNEIAKRLEVWYGITIEIKDSEVGEYRYSGVFENENLIKSLEALQLSYHFNFKIEEEKIIITK